ncbi:tetratricopeptide repeat protein [Microcoleus vaginatus GB1-A2]|uniref:tetratricopeptide repeat protein n=1 Tax=Microcoleus vaginatus TaxID=119532 RepID=UPI00168472AC|nr:tetratricopeptide repeat protein [Microcoleus sp. FACHB-61]
MNFFNKIPIALIGTVATIVIAQPTAVFAISADEVGKIAKSITVLIDSKNPGSGIIIKRNGNTYTVITARHVFKDAQAKYEIVTPDDKRYLLNYSSVKKLPNIDLAVVEFTSSQTYSVAKIGNSDLATEGKAAYVAGFPKTSSAINSSIYNFTDGRITANASRPLEDGYALVYSNNTLPGMSGGPVLNENGEVVGIHGRADTRAAESSSINQDIQIAKTGFNLGIPINTSLRLLASSQVDLGVKVPSAPVATGSKADDFYIQGREKLNKGDYQGAIQEFNQAIQLNPNYGDAYNNRAAARYKLGDNQGTLKDISQFIRINPNYAQGYMSRAILRSKLGDEQGASEDRNKALRVNPSNAKDYVSRAIVRSYLGDKQGAIADLSEALRINPNDSEIYNQRAAFRLELGDKQGALADISEALRINPNNASAYYGRGTVRSLLKDNQGALADYNEALRIDPKFAFAYKSRGFTRHDLGDNQGAISDLNEALRIDPNDALTYHIRGSARYKLGDKQGAITDFNQVLRIDPNDAGAYFRRGEARRDLGDKQGAIQDFQKTADLFQQQGDQKNYQNLLVIIRQLQNNTQTRPTSTTLLSANSSLIPGKSSALPSDGSLYEQHTFVGRAGQSVTITLESSDFDTFVALFSPDGKKLATNDDISRSNTNSALTFTLPASGRYIVVVNAVKKGERGRYTLTIR